MVKGRKKDPAGKRPRGLAVDNLIFWLALAILILVPLAFSTLVYTRYALPKFVVLLVGSSVLLFFLALRATGFDSATGPVVFRSRLVRIVCLYLIVVAVSTALGVAPVASLFGSNFSYMGLITRLCFLIVFIALIAGVGASEKRLRVALWGIAATGFFVAAYGVAQLFGVEPFVSRNLYTFASPEGPLVRVSSTLGHSNYLGNFLLYTTPISVGFALAGRGWPRLFAVATAALSVAAIVFSGTRGAWIGIAVGGVTFALFELKNGAAAVARRHPVALVAGSLLALLLALMIVISPASRSAGERMRAFMREGASSSGRMILWRDSLRMVPAFSLVGCGPEGFRKAALGFKSRELAQLSPNANNESPHCAYLDASISSGLAGAALYIATIVMALRHLIRARRRVVPRNWRVMITGLVSSLVAVLVHNIFIFDQIATGLYFFAFIALAQSVSNAAVGGVTGTERLRIKPATKGKRSWLGSPLAAALCLVIAGSLWYSAGLVRSEMAYRELFDPEKPVDFKQLVELGGKITSSPLPTGAYDFAFSRAVDSFIRSLSAASSSTEGKSSAVDVNAIRTNATNLAIEHVEKSLPHTLTPDLNYSLLASLALAAGDVDKSRYAASEAVRWDPNNYQTRWLLSEAYLAQGELEQASREARLALELNPFSTGAASTRARARGATAVLAAATTKTRIRQTSTHRKRSVEALIEMGRALAEASLLEKARNKLLTAIRRSDGPCADCHRELAIVYERMDEYSEAIAEWEKFIEQDPERASAEQIKERIEALRQKNKPGQ